MIRSNVDLEYLFIKKCVLVTFLQHILQPHLLEKYIDYYFDYVPVQSMKHSVCKQVISPHIEDRLTCSYVPTSFTSLNRTSLVFLEPMFAGDIKKA